LVLSYNLMSSTLSNFRKSSLFELTEAENHVSVNKAFKRIADNANQLFTKQKDFDALREAILLLAVKGRLSRNLSDDSVGKLIEKFTSERLLMVQQKKLPKPIVLEDIRDDDVPFDIPVGWKWCYLQDLLALDRYSMKRGPFGSSLRKGDFVTSGIRVFEQYNPINDDPHWKRYYITEEKYEQMKAFSAKKGDLLISCSGATLGRICELPENVISGIINQALMKITLNQQLILNSYFIRLFRSKYIQDLVWDFAHGMAQPNMPGVNMMKQILVPLPSLSEQRHILAKLEALDSIFLSIQSKIADLQPLKSNLEQSLIVEALGDI